MAEICAAAGVEALDAPVSGGRLAGEERRLTTMVGGPKAVAERCTPVFESFSRHVGYQGDSGAGQVAKLFNNALLMMNQESIAQIVERVPDTLRASMTWRPRSGRGRRVC
jgi:3-hydroxyisobutyrate dehydrogenase-like beta-hydroxyacid dehydrogenase